MKNVTSVKFELKHWSNLEFDEKKSLKKDKTSTSYMLVDKSNKGLLTLHHKTPNETEFAKAQVMYVDGNLTLWTICERSKLYSMLLSRSRYVNASDVSVKLIQ